MRIESFAFTQFRRYASLAVDLAGSDVHVFIGPNGSGKTNLLEGLSVLAFASSPLGVDEDELRQWGADFYRIQARIRADDGEERTLEIVSQVAPRKQKACFRNDVRTPVAEMIGQLPVVVFLPQDMDLFTGAPADRRRFLDQILEQVSSEYAAALTEYQKLLKQRNALLRRIADRHAKPDELELWDERLADVGATLTLFRLELVETLGLSLGEELRALGDVWDQVAFAYQRSTQTRERVVIAKELREQMVHYREKDIILQSTSVGPHRDDWSLLLNGHSAASTASRGQQRVAVLALLLLEASYLQIRRGERPIILLDDIFSELDAQHQRLVLDALKDHQVLLTGTHDPEGPIAGKLWHVRNGTVQEA